MTPILMSLIGESAKPLRSVESDFIVDSSGFTLTRRFGPVSSTTNTESFKSSIRLDESERLYGSDDQRRHGRRDRDKDAAILRGLSEVRRRSLNATAKNFTIARSLGRQGIRLSYENMELVASHGGTPYIAFKSCTTADRGGTLARMFHLYNFNRDDYLKHYHKRSNVETTFSMIKAKFGDSLRSKTDTAMANEALCKVLCHNVCCLIQSACELGVEATFWRQVELDLFILCRGIGHHG